MALDDHILNAGQITDGPNVLRQRRFNEQSL